MKHTMVPLHLMILFALMVGFLCLIAGIDWGISSVPSDTSPPIWIHENTGCHYLYKEGEWPPIKVTGDANDPFCPESQDDNFEEGFDLTPEGQAMLDGAQEILEVR